MVYTRDNGVGRTGMYVWLPSSPLSISLSLRRDGHNPFRAMDSSGSRVQMLQCA